MSYKYNREELYGWSLFTIENGKQIVEVAFGPIEGEAYMMIIYAAGGGDIVGYHEEGFWNTLFDILIEHDENRGLSYEILAR